MDDVHAAEIVGCSSSDLDRQGQLARRVGASGDERGGRRREVVQRGDGVAGGGHAVGVKPGCGVGQHRVTGRAGIGADPAGPGAIGVLLLVHPGESTVGTLRPTEHRNWRFCQAGDGVGRSQRVIPKAAVSALERD